MAKAFSAGRRGITGFLEPAERDLLRKLFSDIITMLEPATPAHEDPLAALIGLDMDVRVPTDPALLRLLPDALTGDADSALEFRQLTERSLRESKIGALRAASLGLDSEKLVLDSEGAKLWAMALNDVRLVLAERLAIRTAEDAERIHEVQDWGDADDVESYLSLVYNFVSWLQESLVQAMLVELQRTK
ncbi:MULTISPECIES: DUF2017 domain-containing protein [Arthrobacter]|uniref:DUF2017 domain-containing protein n=1 Tax=Arthrobacter psychrochitiniphilus TaxID=291045 RepID=A0A2V3DPX4_9MICC|nr:MULTISPECIES: DUF2017 domain-containing protein [Arthrobacter]NYG18205.1 hypothetical protein [Arthrobacter psychrochitiniphilus]PXA64995.1 DUF2017 domain-containing protein [Arthrobacter psychrochitiniphilus]